MKKIILITLLLPFFLFSQNKKSEKKAVKATEAWLTYIDNYQYSESWKNAGEYFKNSIQEGRWFSAMKASREPLGKLIYRKLKSAKYLSYVDGAQDGHYFVVQFDVSYENKKTAIEIITSQKEESGAWRVIEYSIK